MGAYPVASSKEFACNAGDVGLIPGLERSPGEENGNPLQDSCLEIPMERRAWWAVVHVVSKSPTQLSVWTKHRRLTMLDEFQVCCTVIALNIYKLLFFFRFFSYLCVFIRFSHVGLYDPMDRSPPGSSVHGIFKARILEWVVMPSSRGSSWPRDLDSHLMCLLHCRDSLPLSHQGSLIFCLVYYRILSRVPCAIQ